MNETLKIIIDAEVKKFKKGVDDAKKQLTNFKGQVEKAKVNVDANMKKAGEAIGKAIQKGVEVAKKALVGLSAAFTLVTKGTEKYRTDQAKLITTFEQAGASAEQAQTVFRDLYKTIGEDDRAVETANHIAQLTTNQKEMAEWTTICQGVYATFGASLPIEGLTEAANETAKVGTVTGVLADALNWAGVSEDAFNESLAKCNTEAEREALIRKTLNGLYDDAAKKFEENNASVIAQRDAQAKLQETLGKVGEALAPLMTAFTEFTNEALAAALPYIQDFAEKYAPDLKNVLKTTSDVISNIINFVVDNWGFILGIAGIIAGISGAIMLYNAVQTASTAITAAKTAANLAETASLGALIAAQAAAIAPYLLIVAAIGVVIAIIVILITHWNEVVSCVKGAWATIKKSTEDAVAQVKQYFLDLTQGISNKVNEIRENVSNTFTKIKNAIKKPIEEAKTFVGNMIEKIKGFFNFKWELPKLKMPKISITGEFKLLPPQVPKFSISWHEQGGIFDNPTLFPYGGSIHGLGENGAEAIVPLEKNTQWLDKIADRLVGRSASTPIIIQVDGKTFAQTSINTINQLTKQTGELQLIY